MIAALNSIEMVSVPWWFLQMTGGEEGGLARWLEGRLGHVERVLGERARPSVTVLVNENNIALLGQFGQAFHSFDDLPSPL